MNKWLILFVIVLLPVILLYSYKKVAFEYEYDEEQQEVIDYLNDTAVLSDGFTEREAQHLEDVKEVMDALDIVFVIALVAAVLIGRYLFSLKMLSQGFVYGGIAAIAVVALIGAASALNFLGAFDVFHRVFFSPGTWAFSADSKLIQLFPLEFFIGITKSILMRAAFFGLLFIVAGMAIKKRFGK